MDTSKLKKFALFARNSLIEQISAKLELVLADSSQARRECTEAIKSLERNIEQDGKEQVIERVAYIWFNRFCALRFMDVNRYTRIGVVSPAEGQLQPELLAEAKMGHIDEEVISGNIRQQIFTLLANKSPSHDPQGEAYRLLVVATCNYWHRAMPFLFDRIDNYTELLMPDDLLSEHSILACIRDAMTPNACQNVEIIGWLYQFYNSEKKEEVFEGLKKNKKITPENIPEATQLFTPHWIVRYLVENSLGRLWMLNRPHSKLIERMDYYIKPEQPEPDFLRISNPEEIKICDPACGSAHMLVYAFDLLYAIYEEEGYDPSEISKKILTHNLYGIEIDERAGELAAFALIMKARARQKRFFVNPVQPNICVLENVHFQDNELKNYIDFVGKELFTEPLQITLSQFEEADNFGSLIRPQVTDVESILKILEAKKDVTEELFHRLPHQKVLKVLRYADYLSQKYHVVIANPPYMGAKGMNGRLTAWLKEYYPNAKSDLFSAFIMRNTELALPKGHLGYMSPFVWMFLSSYEKLRIFLIDQKNITSLVQLEYSGFDGATVPICIFTLENAQYPQSKGGYIRLSNFRGSDNQGPKTCEAVKNADCGWFYRVPSGDFKKIPGSPIAYWVSDAISKIFSSVPSIGEVCKASNGVQTGNNERFVRNWFEVASGFRKNNCWIPYNKGGEYRKWFGNNSYYVCWQDSGKEIKSQSNSCIRGENNYFKPGITWSDITSARSSFKFFPSGHIFDAKGPSAFVEDNILFPVLGYLNSSLVAIFSKILNPTLSFQIGDFHNLPFSLSFITNKVSLEQLVGRLIRMSEIDWNSYETSWDFAKLPILLPDYRQSTLKNSYNLIRANWRKMIHEMQNLEEENNRIFIGAYGLSDELTPEVPLKEITLTCNPQYRYGDNKSDDELESLLLADTMKEYISYAVGCMFGRYALEKPGLILAYQGETFKDYLKQIPKPIFPACEDNVIPILEGDWFSDDISERFREFIRITFGEEHYEENLRFIELAIGKDIRKYFLKDFYNDHLKRYKKRPIYWLFSSPKGNFNALIYMHRYRPDNVSVILNDYLREFCNKLSSRLDHLKRLEASAEASKEEKTKALKEIEKLKKIIDELDAYEREVLYSLASKQLKINLDDGVKVNYTKFGTALRNIPGIETKEEA